MEALIADLARRTIANRRAVAIAVFATLAGCRRASSASSSDAGPSDASPPPAVLSPPAFERFVAAHPRADGDVDFAGITRDGAVVVTQLDAALKARTVTTLAAKFLATEETDLALADGGVVVAVGTLDDRSGVFLFDGNAPRAIDEEWCLSAGGVAWLAREEGGVRVRFLRKGAAPLDVVSGLVAVDGEHETKLACGPDAVAVSIVDGEELSLARLHPASASFTEDVTPILVEKEGDRPDELRDRTVVSRGGDDVLVVRVGDEGVAMRELTAAGPQPWKAILRIDGKKPRPLVLDPDAVVIETAAAIGAGARAFILASEPNRADKACKDGDPPRHVVLHAVDVASGTDDPRTLVELACGVEAIRARLSVDGAIARLWWTEPIADGSCEHPGLAVGAVVSAGSDAPGAHRHAIVGEGVAAVGSDRWIAVVRPGGCAPYDAAGNGALAWVDQNAAASVNVAPPP